MARSPSSSTSRSAPSPRARAPSFIGTMWLLVVGGSRTKLLQLLHRDRALLSIEARILHAVVHSGLGSHRRLERARCAVGLCPERHRSRVLAREAKNQFPRLLRESGGRNLRRTEGPHD